MWKGEDEKRVAIIQSVNAQQRTAEVLWADSPPGQPPKAVVPVLELDPQGASASIPLGPISESYGVRRGNFVFIHSDGTTNGAELPVVPRIGEREDWTRGLPSPSATGLRSEMAKFGQNFRAQHGALTAAEVSTSVNSSIKWFGEVINVGCLVY